MSEIRMREQDIVALFHAGNPRDARNFDLALADAKSRRNKASSFVANGTVFLLLQDFDTGEWFYRKPFAS